MRKNTVTLTLVTLLLVTTHALTGQTLGRTVTEDSNFEFERRESIYSIPEYEGEPVKVALLSIGITDEILEQYPELGDKRVGLGLMNIVTAFMDETWRFEFVETRDEIKDRMITQSKASAKGFTANNVSAMGNIMLAEYFVYAEIYDFSISNDETINLKDGVKENLVTRLGFQVKLVDAKTGLYMTGSGLGKSVTIREMTLLNDANLSEINFNQSSIGRATKDALNTAVAKLVKRMLRKKIFDH